MGFTIYSGTTYNGIDINDMIDNSDDEIFPFSSSNTEDYFIRCFNAGKQVEDDLEPALVVFHKTEPFQPLYAAKLNGTWADYMEKNGLEYNAVLYEKMEKLKEEFIKSGEKMCEDDIWYALYTHFNDDNLWNADGSYDANGFAGFTAKEMYEVNKSFCLEIMERGVSEEEIVKTVIGTKKYF